MLTKIALICISAIAVFEVGAVIFANSKGAEHYNLAMHAYRHPDFSAALDKLKEVQKDPNATIQPVERFRHLYALNPDEWELKDVYAERWVETGEKKPEPTEDESNLSEETKIVLEWLRSANDYLTDEEKEIYRKEYSEFLRPIRVTFEASELPAYFEFKEEVQEQKRQAALQEKEKADRKKAAELQVAQAETTELLAKVAQEEIDALFAKSEEQINEARRITEQVAANMKGE